MQKWNTLMSPKNLAEFRMTAYTIAGMFSVAHVDNWALSERIRTPVEIIFEDGDAGKATLQSYLSPRKPDPIFRPKKPERRDGFEIPAFTPLQAADILAYELFVRVREVEKQGGDLEWTPPRFALEPFYKMAGNIGYLDAKDFANLDGVLTGVSALLAHS